MARGPNQIRSFLYGYPTDFLMPQERDITQFLEIERIILLNKPIPVLDTISQILAQTGGVLKNVKYMQPYHASNEIGSHVLSLLINISLKENVTAQEIGLTLHNFGEDRFVVIKKITVSDGTVEQELSRPRSSAALLESTHPGNSNFSIEKSFSVPIKDVKSISIELEQRSYYPIRYALALYTAQIQQDSSGGSAGTTTGAATNPNAKVGWVVDLSSKEIAYNIAKLERENFTSETLKGLPAKIMGYLPKLLTEVPGIRPTAQDVPELFPDTDVLDNFALENVLAEDGLIVVPREESNRVRYAIGVSNIRLNSRNYSTQSEFLSKTFSTPIIRTVSLEVEDFIPESFPTGDWIKYYISIDEGSSWYRISPLNHSQKYFDGTNFVIPRVILVNSNDSAIIRDKNPSGTQAYIDTNTAILGVRVRSILARPDGEQFSMLSPEILSYRVRVGR